MGRFSDEVDRVATETDFAGVVRVDRRDELLVASAYGLADRARVIAMTTKTQLAIASGSKGLTALLVMSLVEDGLIALSTPARSLLRDDLPLVDDDVTVEHLLAHRSGIGDYLDEDAGLEISDYVMPVPVHELASTEQFLAVLDGHPRKFAPGSDFSYCNGGYVILALLAERASGTTFHDLVRERVCEPAGMMESEFFRSDQLPRRAGLGYVQMDGGWRTNVFHLPVRGNGDGGLYTTVGDVHRLWSALFGGRIVSGASVAQMTWPRSTRAGDRKRYGMGFWLHESRDVVILEGCDAGVSFRSTHDPATRLTQTVIANTSSGAWPVAWALESHLAGCANSP